MHVRKFRECCITQVTCESHALSHVTQSRVRVEFGLGWRYHDLKEHFHMRYHVPEQHFFFTRNNVWTKKTFGWYLASQKVSRTHSAMPNQYNGRQRRQELSIT